MRFFKSIFSIQSSFSLIVLPLLVLLCNSCEKPVRVIGVRTDAVTDISYTSCSVEGAIIDMGDNDIENHGFCYSLTENPTIENLTKLLGPVSALLEFTDSITGLSPNTTYYVKAFAQTNVDVYYGAQLSFTTLGLQAPSVRTDTASSLTETAVTVGGEVTMDGGLPVNERGIWYGTSASAETTGKQIEVGSGTGSFSRRLIGLESGTKYYVKAYAVNDAGTGYGEEVSFTTKLAAPTVKTTAEILKTTTTASVGGEVLTSGGATIIDRGVWYSTTAGAETTGIKRQIGNGVGSFSTNLTGLTPGTKYYVIAYATNSIGTTYGVEYSFQTFNGTITDYEGNVYFTAVIGSQEWMAENLKTTHYANGTAIPVIESSTEWAALGSTDKAYCFYNNVSSNRDNYGTLYTWAAAMNGAGSSNSNPSGIQGVCPDGFHLPSDAEWKELEMYLGMSQSEADGTGERGTVEGCRLAGNAALWAPGRLTMDNAYGTSNFMGIPGGYRSSNGSFLYIRNNGFYSSSSEASASYIWYRLLFSNDKGVQRGYTGKNVGLSVRCLRD